MPAVVEIAPKPAPLTSECSAARQLTFRIGQIRLKQRIGNFIRKSLETLHIRDAHSMIGRGLDHAQLIEFHEHLRKTIDADPEITGHDCAFQRIVDQRRIAPFAFVLMCEGDEKRRELHELPRTSGIDDMIPSKRELAFDRIVKSALRPLILGGQAIDFVESEASDFRVDHGARSRRVPFEKSHSDDVTGEREFDDLARLVRMREVNAERSRLNSIEMGFQIACLEKHLVTLKRPKGVVRRKIFDFENGNEHCGLAIFNHQNSTHALRSTGDPPGKATGISSARLVF